MTTQSTQTTQTSINPNDVIARAARLSALAAAHVGHWSELRAVLATKPSDGEHDALDRDFRAALGTGADGEAHQRFDRDYMAAAQDVAQDADAAARAHLASFNWRPSDGVSDADLGIGSEAWGDSLASEQWASLDSRAWSGICSNMVRIVARELRDAAAED